MQPSAQDIIDQLQLQPHPEGGWYREYWRGPDAGGRGTGTAIYYLLQHGQRSHWHRIDATELWLFQAGGPLRLMTAQDGAVVERQLGPNLLAGQVLPGCFNLEQAKESLREVYEIADLVVPGHDNIFPSPRGFSGR